MRKVLLAFALSASLCGFAQIFNVGEVTKVNLPANVDNLVAGISPDGSYLLVTNSANKGLAKFDLATSQSQVLSTAPGAGFDAQISQDGNTVVYRENSFTANHLRKVALNSKNLATGEVTNLVAPTRDLQGVAVEGTTANVVNKGKFSAKGLNGAKAVKAPVLSINNRQLMITKDGKTSVFSPNGQQFSYIWQSVSPDATKALYFVCGVGAFVCDLDGSNIKSLGLVRAPQWYDNNTIVGMQDKDNGEYILSSKVVAVTLDGTMQTLTSDDVIAMYPYASPATGKIAFSTPAGEAYIINVNK
ncbi:hypothetical protein [Sodaliphilus sp.]|uniref:hypothetical protein n=1 Tax=Sodaliphilus sp. TaxID=2815818 RepID=UPI00388EAA97